jgi:magnesium-transporting ATPase (P-type)
MSTAGTLDAASARGLSGAEAEKRLRKLGPPPETSSRSVSSIVAANVFTLFNAIIGAFFVLDMTLGLYADSLFGLIAVINSYIGIRQELQAKRTLDELAVLVAPHAKVVRDGEAVKLLATEVVPGDVVHVEPGDQLVADGEVIRTRGMTLDESARASASGLSRAPSASPAPATTWSTRSVRTATPGDSRARRRRSATRPRRCRTRSTG